MSPEAIPLENLLTNDLICFRQGFQQLNHGEEVLGSVLAMWIALDLEPARHIVVDDEENKTLENQCWSLSTQVETENSAHQSQPAGVVSWANRCPDNFIRNETSFNCMGQKIKEFLVT